MNKQSKLLSIIVVAFALALMFALAGCGQQASSSSAAASSESASASAASTSAASTSATSASATSASAAAASTTAASTSTTSASANAAPAAASTSAASAPATEPAADEVSYTITIDASDADKGLLFEGIGTAKKGATVYDVLIDTELDLSVITSSGSTYVDGIADVVASEVGPNAGWLFTVNGESPNVGADAYQIADGDEIVWKFTSDFSAQ